MTKQTKPQEEERKPGPKFSRSVLPENFQIRRPTSPMADLLDEASGPPREVQRDRIPERHIDSTPERVTPVKSTPVGSTPVKTTTVETPPVDVALPELDIFLDVVLPRFPPARQALLLRLYRWSEGREKEIVVSTPRLAAKTNMDEKSCRSHLHALIADGYVLRSMEGEHHARFGGNDRSARGLILRLSAAALADLAD
jgi:hypothetical protein